MRIRFGVVKLDGTQDACRESEDCADQLEDAANYDANQPEGQEDQPDERVKQERQQRRGPANDDEEDEEEEFHGVDLSTPGYAQAGSPVPLSRVALNAVT
jgi:hypothetical protein